jgi:hypothetical protein
VRSDELAAAALLAELLNRDAIVVDRPGDGDRLHDWNLRARDGTTIALEVTMHTDSDYLSFWSGGDQYREFPDLGGMYLVEVDASAKRNELWRYVPAIVPRLPEELLGVHIADAQWDSEDATLMRDRQRLLTRGVTCVELFRGRRSAVAFTTPGEEVPHPDVVVRAAMSEVEPNRAKLAAAADVDERHLFVWIDGSALAASTSLQHDKLPTSAAPDFGEAVDVLWIAGVDLSRKPMAAQVLWRGVPGGAWTDWRPRLGDTPAYFGEKLARVIWMGLEWEQVVVDAADPEVLGRWWAEALEWVVVNEDPQEFEIRPAPYEGPGLLFVHVPEPRTVRDHLHLGFRPESQAAAVARLVELGATHAAVGLGDESSVVLRDPEGNEFGVLSGREMWRLSGPEE